MDRKPTIVVLYHYYYPDDVVSARHYQDFCEELAARGWDVAVWPSNRLCRFSRMLSLKARETKSGVSIRRVWRPPFRQSSFMGRILNTASMLISWSWRIAWTGRKNQPDIVLLGTDPPATVFLTSLIRLFWRKTKIALWCFDMVFEIALANGIIKPGSAMSRITRKLYETSYRKMDFIADLGSCMREALDKYGPLSAARRTLTPWALSEPSSYCQPITEDRKAFSGKPPLVILYSGNFGVAHSYNDILALARSLRNDPVVFVFGARGNRVDELKAATTPDDSNIVFLPFVKESRLENRLTASHIHLASLKEEITGCVVPSKFFGSLAAGRPVLFAGSSQACISKWIEEFKVGWILNRENIAEVAAQLRRFALNTSLLAPYYERCFKVYGETFSKDKVMSAWDAELRSLIAQSPSRGAL